ncbi:alpha/beta fold hydrolase [Streptomyces sp. NPDC005898]|uniref:thioesterase II family protein n=1 Tax=Streptomyces sp. NPDC005898 TaxID=3157082 RepID=UPI00340F1907
MTGASSAWVRQFHPAPEAATRLVCFPHAGGSAPFYHPVSQRLSPAVDVLAIQYPGRQDRRHEPCVETVEALAEQLVDELRPWLDKPVTLFGHSMGASVAFEVARRLEAAGTVPLGLFASGRRAPSRPRDERVHESDDDGLIAEMKRLSGTDAAVLGDEELLRMVLPAIRADYRAAELYRYAPGPRLNCPIYALVGEDDPKVTVDEATSWADHTNGPFDIKVFKGGHFYINANASAVMDAIEAHIEGAAPVS